MTGSRCRICGRPRGFIRKFEMCRICFRNLALADDREELDQQGAGHVEPFGHRGFCVAASYDGLAVTYNGTTWSLFPNQAVDGAPDRASAAPAATGRRSSSSKCRGAAWLSASACDSWWA